MQNSTYDSEALKDAMQLYGVPYLSRDGDRDKDSEMENFIRAVIL